MNKSFLGALGLSLLLAASTFACEVTSTDTSSPDGGIPDAGADTGSDAGIDPATCPATGTAAVTVEVTGLPAGTNPKITATGTAGATDLSTGGTLGGGVYTIAAPAVTTADPRVRTAYKATLTSASQVCVKDGEAQKITVSYALIPSSNQLWQLDANGTSELLGFKSADIATTAGADAPTGIPVSNPTGIAFDKDGGLWTTADAGGVVSLVHYPASVLGTGGAKTADVTVSSSALNAADPKTAYLAFDPNGNLWVTAPATNKILRFDAAKLTTSGTFEPTVVMGGNVVNLDLPSAIAFDDGGNLWICDNGNNRLVEYKAARLAASSDTQDVAITTGLTGVRGLAFDGQKNLWANFDRVLVKLTPADLAATNTVTPSIKITLDVNALPEQLAFDETGGLWFAYSASSFGRLSASQLTTSTPDGDTASPEIVVSSIAVGSTGDIALYPAPANTPMFSRLP